MKKVNIFKLEDRVLFDAAGVADAVDAANQAASAEASAAQEQAQDSKEALKNAPPENPADAAANAQAQQNHSNPGEAADLDAAANKIVEGEIVPGQAPEQADAPADGADVDASAADTDGEAPDADHAAAESQGGDAGDSGDAGDAGDINDVPLGDIDDLISTAAILQLGCSIILAWALFMTMGKCGWFPGPMTLMPPASRARTT
ncbi:hypothetical protein [Victivallis vadensis]|uniref:Uncharacterized protein n=1 Tax=Victivallis vadensis TaxID=172901 RepID=A0A2U1ADH2_9BACT|nr:hypothetical protein [Victivallis vadensis]PVY34464.1 hypothetical protein C8D82_14927 [Victivallis vadensis]